MLNGQCGGEKSEFLDMKVYALCLKYKLKYSVYITLKYYWWKIGTIKVNYGYEPDSCMNLEV